MEANIVWISKMMDQINLVGDLGDQFQVSKVEMG